MPGAMLSPYLTSGKRPSCAFVAAALVLSCDSSVSVTDQDVASIEINPPAIALTTGATRVLSAIVRDERGAILENGDVHWSVQDANVASIMSPGIVTAIAAGKTNVAASKGGRSAIAAVSVSTLPPALVRVSPTSSTMFVGATTTLTAEVRDAGGGILTGYPFTWSSANAAIASVRSGGVVTGVAPGNVVIKARAAGLAGTAVVTVRQIPVATVTVAPTTGTVAVGQSLQLSVSLLDAVGQILTGRSVAWSTADPNTATVTSGGLVRGRAKGTTVITTTSEAKSATSTITVP
ncbi:MAG: Ig-like domain-containing protein [Gemmatimonadaceae bacterium]